MDRRREEGPSPGNPEKGLQMLISPSLSEPTVGQGCPRADFAELRRGLTAPSMMDDGSRQRLVDFARRLARVRARGDEYLRVDFSEYAVEALALGSAV